MREEEIAKLGEEIYARIREEIEEGHEGEVVLIEVESGDYFVAPTLKEAYEKARKAHPGKLFYARRIGRKPYAVLRLERGFFFINLQCEDYADIHLFTLSCRYSFLIHVRS